MQAYATALERLEREYLKVRCGLLDLAAALDRIERGSDAEAVRGDPRWEQIRRSLHILLDGEANRAERIQMVFSDDYDEVWQDGNRR